MGGGRSGGGDRGGSGPVGGGGGGVFAERRRVSGRRRGVCGAAADAVAVAHVGAALARGALVGPAAHAELAAGLLEGGRGDADGLRGALERQAAYAVEQLGRHDDGGGLRDGAVGAELAAGEDGGQAVAVFGGGGRARGVRRAGAVGVRAVVGLGGFVLGGGEEDEDVADLSVRRLDNGNANYVVRAWGTGELESRVVDPHTAADDSSV
mmetsp:Transcript_2882/g.6232  ORF Transcript_2882/g.6232 Transcript_2882/m.6232 type:complete len:209 (-) Transcript_2882:680-1306(-)